MRTDNQQGGVGRRLIEDLKQRYQQIVTFADLRAIGFYEKMGFVKVPEESIKGQQLLDIM